MSTKNARVAGGPLMRYDDRAQGECSPPPGRGAVTEAGERISKARARVWELISQLNECADAVFGATPSLLEGNTEPAPPGALGMLLVEIAELERAVPSLERAIERFASLA